MKTTLLPGLLSGLLIFGAGAIAGERGLAYGFGDGGGDALQLLLFGKDRSDLGPGAAC